MSEHCIIMGLSSRTESTKKIILMLLHNELLTLIVQVDARGRHLRFEVAMGQCIPTRPLDRESSRIVQPFGILPVTLGTQFRQ